MRSVKALLVQRTREPQVPGVTTRCTSAPFAGLSGDIDGPHPSFATSQLFGASV
ncbi:hypothetical protein [Celeribacter sp.]|uniref:hypothetical protein n=1 Tax=Celeribacter sp. TaxID=1890673 RepID=UPI003A94388D